MNSPCQLGENIVEEQDGPDACEFLDQGGLDKFEDDYGDPFLALGAVSFQVVSVQAEFVIVDVGPGQASLVAFFPGFQGCQGFEHLPGCGRIVFIKMGQIKHADVLHLLRNLWITLREARSRVPDSACGNQAPPAAGSKTSCPRPAFPRGLGTFEEAVALLHHVQVFAQSGDVADRSGIWPDRRLAPKAGISAHQVHIFRSGVDHLTFSKIRLSCFTGMSLIFSSFLPCCQLICTFRSRPESSSTSPRTLKKSVFSRFSS